MKRITICILIASLILLSSCSENNSDITNKDTEITNVEVVTETQQELTDTKPEYAENSVTFPSGDYEITDDNNEILSISPFNIQFTLPSEWSITDTRENDNKYLGNGLFCAKYVYDKDNNCVGMIGYSTIPDIDEIGRVPQAIYSQISIGNNYRFDIREKYDVVSDSEISETAVTTVYYSANISDNQDTEKFNRGIVTYDLSKNIFAAFEFDCDMLSEEQCFDIAKSIEIS